MKKVVVTCITNDYDTLKTPLVDNTSDYEFICFTDNPLVDNTSDYEFICFTDNPSAYSSDIWKIKKIPKGVTDREIKIKTHQFIDYDLCLWVDASIHIIGDVLEFEDLLEDYSLLIKRHPISDSIKKEFSECFRLNRGNPEILVRQQGDYFKSGVLNLPVYELNIILKKNTGDVNAIMELWWEEYNKYPSRDQLSFPVALKQSNNQSSVVGYEWKMFGATFYLGFHKKGNLKHKNPIKRSLNFWDFTPYCTNKEVGKKINEFCDMVPDNDWIIIRDPDTLYPDPFYGHLIKKVIRENLDVDLFGCFTNRLGLTYQLVYPQMANNRDMSYHTVLAEHLRLKHDTETEECHANIGGLFLMFNKQVWQDIKFIDTITDEKGYMDYHFSSEVLRRGGKVKLIKGLYLYHNYRILHGVNAPFRSEHIK